MAGRWLAWADPGGTVHARWLSRRGSRHTPDTDTACNRQVPSGRAGQDGMLPLTWADLRHRRDDLGQPVELCPRCSWWTAPPAPQQRFPAGRRAGETVPS